MSVYVPNVKMCINQDMFCFVTLTTSYTAGLNDPYTLNTYTTRIRFTKAASSPGTITIAQDSKLSASYSTREICLMSNWNFYFTQNFTMYAGDAFIFKFPKNRFTFLRYGYSSNFGNVVLIDHYPTNELYYFIYVTGTVSSSTNR
jgi:hypothetical protein